MSRLRTPVLLFAGDNSHLLSVKILGAREEMALVWLGGGGLYSA